MLYAFALHVILVVVVVPRGTYHNFFTPIFPHSYEMSSLLLSDVIKTLGVGETREKKVPFSFFGLLKTNLIRVSWQYARA